jgi:hypothetical protein
MSKASAFSSSEAIHSSLESFDDPLFLFLGGGVDSRCNNGGGRPSVSGDVSLDLRGRWIDFGYAMSHNNDLRD